MKSGPTRSDQSENGGSVQSDELCDVETWDFLDDTISDRIPWA
jgi:hypothetical protein